MTGIVIVGAGQAGASLAAKLRQLGYAGKVTMIGAEPVPPYQRPPLSKGYLLGETELERLFLRTPSFWHAQEVTLKLGIEVTGINRAEKLLRVGNASLPYDQLVLATGAVARRLPAAIGGDLQGVYTIRSLADVNAIAAEFRPGRRLLIVGGGYIGLEAAAVAAHLGLKVTLIEKEARILQRVAAAETSSYFRALHQSHGVEICENTGLERLMGDPHVSEALLSDGRSLPVDFVITGTGVVPATRLAERAGLSIDNGIQTDAYGRSSDPDIWAIGDCASFPHQDGRLRLESVGHAIHHAETVAENLLGAERPYEARPWFWSDQYDVKLQIAGLNSGYDRVISRRGDGAELSIWYFRGQELLAIDAMNAPRAYMIGKRMIEAQRSPDPERVGDASIPLSL